MDWLVSGRPPPGTHTLPIGEHSVRSDFHVPQGVILTAEGAGATLHFETGKGLLLKGGRCWGITIRGGGWCVVRAGGVAGGEIEQCTVHGGVEIDGTAAPVLRN